MQGGLSDFSDVGAVYADTAGGHVVKPGYQLAEGGFATAGGADNGHRLPRLNVQVHMVQHGQISVVGKGQVIDVNFPHRLIQDNRVRRVFLAGLRGHDFPEAGQAGKAAGKHF